MGALKYAEQRFFPRYQTVTKSVEAELTRQRDERALAFQVMDVSRDGLGILLDTPLVPGEQVVFALGKKSIPFVVRHCQEDLIYKGRHRAGLMRAGSKNENLLQLFSLHGYLSPTAMEET